MSQLSNSLDSYIPVARITDLLEKPGECYDYEGRTRTYPDIRLVYWAGGNPFHHHQDLNRLDRAWQRPETVVVQDPMWTPTALRADIVLPASTSIERNDIAGNRRTDMVVAMKQAIAPVGEARSDFEIFASLAEKLGVREGFTEGRDEMGWLRHIYDLTRADARSVTTCRCRRSKSSGTRAQSMCLPWRTTPSSQISVPIRSRTSSPRRAGVSCSGARCWRARGMPIASRIPPGSRMTNG